MLGLLVCTAGPVGLAGQAKPAVRPGPANQAGPPSAWLGELAFLGGNAALGGLTAGLLRAVRGGSFWEAFRNGFAGGALAYAGRRIAAEQVAGAGLL
ncbi:MAG: hypothetical protein ACRELD_16625, partial [Longimicrobiales bacterium]